MYWGGCHPRKRIAETLQALEKSNIDVIVVGEVPPGCNHLCRSVGAASTSELVNLIDGCDVALYPSADEGFGLPVFEALLRDRPVVCQRLPSYRDLISREDASGLIFIDDSDIAWMPEAVTQAVSDYRQGSAIASLAVSDYDACVRTLRTELHNWVTDASDGTMP
jgi:glycosyltransferase involved in cell wall biosynthesis